VLDRTVIAFPPNGIALNNPTKAGSQFITPKIGMAIDLKTGTLMPEREEAFAQKPVLVPVAPEGYAWAVFSTSRDIKREIRANLQASLNPMVNVSFKTPFLEVLRAEKSAFTIMLRWTSRSFKETTPADPQEDIVKRNADADKAKEIETKWQKDLEAEIAKQKKAANEKHDKEKTEAEQKVKEDADKAEKDWIEKFQTIPDGQKTAEITKHEQEKNAAAQKAKDDAKQAVTKWNATLATIERHKQTETAKHKQERKDDEQKKADTFIIRSITSRAWIIGVWQVKRARMSKTDFDDLKATVIKYFSEPKTIENGCDYISSITTTDMNMDEGSGMEANTTSNKKKKVAKKPSASFHMYASDGPLGDEIHVVDSGSASYAFAAIDRRMNLSSIHIRPVKGEIQAPGGAEFPATSSLNEAALLQIQEARTSMAYLKTCNPSAVTTYVTALEERLDRGKNGYLFKNTPFPTNLFTELDKAEMGLRKND
jgi:chemotaxis protein histidine kinase CheA